MSSHQDPRDGIAELRRLMAVGAERGYAFCEPGSQKSVVERIICAVPALLDIAWSQAQVAHDYQHQPPGYEAMLVWRRRMERNKDVGVMALKELAKVIA